MTSFRQQLLASLVCAVHDKDSAEIDRIMDDLTEGELRRLLLSLAGAIDPERPLGDLIPADTYAGTIGRIVTLIEQHTWVEGHEIYERNQHRHVAHARQVVCWVATQCGLSSVKIGRTLDRDHATVLHAIKKVERSPNLLELGQTILAELRAQKHAA